MKLFPTIIKRTTGGGGAPPVVAIGPDFGESSDDNTFTVGVDGPVMDSLALEGNLTVGDNVALTNLTIDYTSAGVAAPVWQSVTTAALSVAAASIVVNVPSGTVVGDLLLAFIYTVDSAAPRSVTTPAGWTSVQTVSYSFGRGTCFKRIADSEPASYTFSFSGSANSATGEMHRITGANVSTPINSISFDGFEAASGIIDPVVFFLTPTDNNTLLMLWYGHEHGGATQSHTAPAGFTERSDFESLSGGIRIGSTSVSKTRATAGADGPPNYVLNCTQTTAAAYGAIGVVIQGPNKTTFVVGSTLALDALDTNYILSPTTGIAASSVTTLQVNNLVASKDSWCDIVAACPTDLNRNGTPLQVDSVVATRKDTVIGFDLSLYPTGFTVTDATLRLVLHTAPTVTAAMSTSFITTATETWAEATVKCSTVPAIEAGAASAINIFSTDAPGTVYTIVFTAAALTRIAARMGVGTFSLRLAGGAGLAGMQLWDKDTGAAANRPQLTFTAVA